MRPTDPGKFIDLGSDEDDPMPSGLPGSSPSGSEKAPEPVAVKLEVKTEQQPCAMLGALMSSESRVMDKKDKQVVTSGLRIMQHEDEVMSAMVGASHLPETVHMLVLKDPNVVLPKGDDVHVLTVDPNWETTCKKLAARVSAQNAVAQTKTYSVGDIVVYRRDAQQGGTTWSTASRVIGHDAHNGLWLLHEGVPILCSTARVRSANESEALAHSILNGERVLPDAIVQVIASKLHGQKAELEEKRKAAAEEREKSLAQIYCFAPTLSARTRELTTELAGAQRISHLYNDHQRRLASKTALSKQNEEQEQKTLAERSVHKNVKSSDVHESVHKLFEDAKQRHQRLSERREQMLQLELQDLQAMSIHSSQTLRGDFGDRLHQEAKNRDMRMLQKKEEAEQAAKTLASRSMSSPGLRPGDAFKYLYQDAARREKSLLERQKRQLEAELEEKSLGSCGTSGSCL
eukprot:s521_g12.t1